MTVDRPDALNALDLPTLTELRDRLGELAGDDEARVLVVTGAGDKAFVAGADIKYMSGLGADDARAWGALGHEAARLLETMAKPTPQTRASRCVPPHPGMIPRLISGWPKWAFSEASRTSQASAISQPPPSA